MARSKRTKAVDFSQKDRIEIIKRDKGKCIFCEMGYHLEEATTLDLEIKDLMHYIPRSAGGLGIAKNAAVGCRHHHTMFDNGYQGRHTEMKEIFKEYLKGFYPDWDEEKLVYNKWDFLKGENNVTGK